MQQNADTLCDDTSTRASFRHQQSANLQRNWTQRKRTPVKINSVQIDLVSIESAQGQDVKHRMQGILHPQLFSWLTVIPAISSTSASHCHTVKCRFSINRISRAITRICTVHQPVHKIAQPHTEQCMYEASYTMSFTYIVHIKCHRCFVCCDSSPSEYFNTFHFASAACNVWPTRVMLAMHCAQCDSRSSALLQHSNTSAVTKTMSRCRMI